MSQNRNLSIHADYINSSGVLTPSGGGLGITTIPANGQIPIGNGTNYTAATITAGTGISVTNGAGSINIANTAIPKGLGQSGEVWHNVSGSRSFGTTYTNSNTYPIMVVVTVANLTSANYPTGNASLTVGGVGVASTGFYTGGGQVIPLTAIVPPSTTYSVTLNGGLNAVLGNWAELY